MIALSTTSDVLAAMQHAHLVTFTAYVMRPGPVLSALERAASHGTRVVVRLEGQPYGDTSGDLLRGNDDAIAALRASGVDASLSDPVKEHPLHLKAAVIDERVAFLDDRNWPDDGLDTIVRDDNASDVRSALEAIAGKPRNDAPLATQKDPALRREARTIYHAADAHGSIDVESESFGYGRISAALIAAADQHSPVRLIVAQRDLGARSRSVLQKLSGHGISIRICANDEKMAVAGDQAWLGSANATMGVEDQLDWGLRIFDRALVSALEARFERNWEAATPYAPGA